MNAEVDFLQAERILRVESPLGPDNLLAQKLNLSEGVSDLFHASLVVRSKTPDLTPQDLLGKAVDVSLELGGGERRAWNAIVTELMAGARHTRGLREYTLTLRPDLWLLSQTSDCRIWLDKTALDVAQDLCREHGVRAPIVSGVVDPEPVQHYSVQWNESDLDYLLRRLEEDGLFYWWTHEPGAHQLHIASHARWCVCSIRHRAGLRRWGIAIERTSTAKSRTARPMAMNTLVSMASRWPSTGPIYNRASG